MTELEMIYRKRREDLIKYAASRLRNPDRAEEVVQEAFVYALERIQGVSGKMGASAPRYLYTFINNRVRALVFNANHFGPDVNEVSENN